jgi:hypothetical protein
MNSDDDLQVAAKMRHLSVEVNTLKEVVEEQHLERKSAVWQPVNDISLEHFPKLNEENLRSLTCGVYQLKLCSSYIQEHLDGHCDIHIHKDEDDLIRVKIQSRHVSSKKYCLWIRFNSSEITAWYCKCRAGARVVGVCAHIASVIWYLSFARHEQINQYGVKDWGATLADASKLPEPVDESDSESETSVIEE